MNFVSTNRLSTGRYPSANLAGNMGEEYMDFRSLLLAAAAVYLVSGGGRPARAVETTTVQAVQEQVDSQPGTITTYTVIKGDTLRRIADDRNLQVSTLQWANGIKNPDVIEVGQVLRLPPVDGVLHRVEAGQTLDEIADMYKIPLADLLDANDVDDHEGLEPDTLVVVPGGKPLPKAPAKVVARPQRFTRPVAGGRITSRYGYRIHPISRSWRLHTGLDIAKPKGAAIKACRDGVVILARAAGGYGNLVILNHGNGLTTRYGHCSSLLVKPGQFVRQGQVIARVGSTGNSTGPHLHLEVRQNGKSINPVPYLKGWKK